MAYAYELRTFDSSGTAQRRLTDYLQLSVMLAVNRPGVLSARIGGYNVAAGELDTNSQVELWRNDPDKGVTWTRVFSGLVLRQRREWRELPILEITAPGVMWLLGTRTIAWYTGYSNRSAFVAQPAETISKTLVSYNAAASATVANGRKREGAIGGLTVEADGGGGNALDWFCFGDNLLESLQKLAQVGGGDFDLVKTGAAAYEFRWYAGQLGTDRTATVKFSMTNGSMANPVYVYDRARAKSVACVWGQEAGSAREYATRTSADYNVATNNVEMHIDARDVTTSDGLNDRGDERLRESFARTEFGFDVVQTENMQYGVDYQLGDLVTVENPFTGASSTQKIDTVTITLSEQGREQISVGLATP